MAAVLAQNPSVEAMNSGPVITIDGGAHTGKSTAARLLAAALGWDWVSTGAFYRGLACVADRAGVSPDDERGLVDLIHRGEFRVVLTPGATRFEHRGEDLTPAIFDARIGELTPRISRLAGVRAGLLDAQRGLVAGRRGLVMEGRDCGTVVFPTAPLKIWFVVSDEAAAARWAAGHGVGVEAAMAHIRERNRRDVERATARMLPAADAVTLDTSRRSPDEVVAELVRLARGRGLASGRAVAPGGC